MALSIVNGLLEEYVQSLFNEGIVNSQFSHYQDVKTTEGAECAVQLISEYCTDVETILSEFTSYIDLPDIDFPKLAELAGEIERKSSRIGAEHVRLAGLNLKQACDEMHKQRFLRNLDLTKNEFTRTQDKLQVVVQMERRIMRLEAKQRK
ncbi:hypothetical protein SLE2022_004500 [Rubroshorea leprosula]